VVRTRFFFAPGTNQTAMSRRRGLGLVYTGSPWTRVFISIISSSKVNDVSKYWPPFARIFNGLLQNKNKLFHSRRKGRSSTDNSIRVSQDDKEQLLQTLKHENPLSDKDNTRPIFLYSKLSFSSPLKYNFSKSPKMHFVDTFINSLLHEIVVISPHLIM
jgi:hypothetical protein